MIDSFEILVPSTIQVGSTFEVLVRALDASGSFISDDSTTVVTLTSTDLGILFDANSDGTFTVLDNSKTLSNGEATFLVQDTANPVLSFTADNSPEGPITVTNTVTLASSFNTTATIALDVLPETYAAHPRSALALDLLERYEPVRMTPKGTLTSNPTELTDELRVTQIV